MAHSVLQTLQLRHRYAVRPRALAGLGACECAAHRTLGDTPDAARMRGEQAIAAVKAAYRSGTLKGYRLGSLGASGAASGASQGASAGAAVGGVYGAAIGAVVGALAGAFMKKKDPNAAEKEALKGNLDKYMQVQGQIPGRAMDLLTIKQLIDGAGYRGMWPNVKKWSGDAITGAIDGCKGCTPPTIRDFVREQVGNGDIDPFSLANKFTDHVQKTWGSKWFLASAGATQRQLMVDLMDFFIAQNRPDAPLFYAPTWTSAANQPPPATAIPTPAPAPLPIPTTPAVSTPGTVPSGYELIRAATGSSPAMFKDANGKLFTYVGGQFIPYTESAQTPGTTPPPQVVSVNDPNLQAYIKALMDQGASQQQAFTAALSALGNSGVAPTPQVQAAVADQVQQAGTGSGLPNWVLYAAGAAALVLALARPASAHRSRGH